MARDARRRWRVCTWANLSVAALGLGAWLLSFGWVCQYGFAGGHAVGIGSGCAELVWGADWASDRGWIFYPLLGRRDADLWLPEFARYSPRGFWLTLPLWMVFVPAAAAGAWGWLVLRRLRRSGHSCRCGYALAGLPAGAPCPECGRGGDGGPPARVGAEGQG